MGSTTQNEAQNQWAPEDVEAHMAFLKHVSQPVTLSEYCRSSWLMLNSGEAGSGAGRTQEPTCQRVCGAFPKVPDVSQNVRRYFAAASAWSPPRAGVHCRRAKF